MLLKYGTWSKDESVSIVGLYGGFSRLCSPLAPLLRSAFCVRHLPRFCVLRSAFCVLRSLLSPLLRSAFATPPASAFCVRHSPRFCVLRLPLPRFFVLCSQLARRLLRSLFATLRSIFTKCSTSAFCILSSLCDFCVLYSLLCVLCSPIAPLLCSAFATASISAFCVRQLVYASASGHATTSNPVLLVLHSALWVSQLLHSVFSGLSISTGVPIHAIRCSTCICKLVYSSASMPREFNKSLIAHAHRLTSGAILVGECGASGSIIDSE